MPARFQMSKSPTLDAYFARIGWGGPTTADFATLSGLLAAHMRSIPFENLDVLAGDPIRLGVDDVHAKLVAARRGGYCFEHATLFADVLDRLGFSPQRHSARVVLFFPRTQSPRGHMFLTLRLAGTDYVVDPGLGGPAATRPIPLVDMGADGDGASTHWMIRDGGYWLLRTRQDGASRDVWASTLEADNLIDFEVANHFMQTHAKSPFRSRLMASRCTPDGRVTIMNREASLIRDGRRETVDLASRAALRDCLAEHFGIDYPRVERLALPFISEWQ